MLRIGRNGRRMPLVLVLAVSVTALAAAAGSAHAQAKAEPATPTPAPASDIASLEARVKANPADAGVAATLAAAYLDRAKRLADVREYARADAAIEEALKRDPKHVPALVLQASCRLAQHRFQDAVAAAERALALEPDARQALALRGDARVQLGDLPRAREDYQKLLDAEAADVSAHARMAQLQFAEGDAAAAAATLEAALQADGQRAEPPAPLARAALQLGELRFRTGDWDEADRWYAKAAEIHPDDPDTLDHLAELHAARGEFDKALELSAKAISLSPRPEFQQARGDIYMAKAGDDNANGDAEAEALACYDKALARYTEAAEAGHGQYLHQMAGIYCDVDALRDPTEALRWAKRDLQLRRSVTSYDGMAWVEYHAGNFKEAAEWMDKALREPTADAHVLYHAGLIYSRAGDAKKGRLYLRRASVANPKFNEFHFHR